MYRAKIKIISILITLAGKAGGSAGIAREGTIENTKADLIQPDVVNLLESQSLDSVLPAICRMRKENYDSEVIQQVYNSNPNITLQELIEILEPEKIVRFLQGSAILPVTTRLADTGNKEIEIIPVNPIVYVSTDKYFAQHFIIYSGYSYFGLSVESIDTFADFSKLSINKLVTLPSKREIDREPDKKELLDVMLSIGPGFFMRDSDKLIFRYPSEKCRDLERLARLYSFNFK